MAISYAKGVRESVYAKCLGHCAYCGTPIEFRQMEIDHIQSKRRGGANHIDNYLPSCASCNSSKATLTVEEFRERLQGDVARLRRDSAKFRILERVGLIKQVKTEVVFYFERGNKWQDRRNRK